MRPAPILRTPPAVLASLLSRRSPPPPRFDSLPTPTRFASSPKRKRGDLLPTPTRFRRHSASIGKYSGKRPLIRALFPFFGKAVTYGRTRDLPAFTNTGTSGA